MDMDVEAMLEAPFHQQQQTTVEVSRNGMENGTSDRQSRELSEKRRSDKHYRDRSSSRSSRHRHRSISRSRRSSKDRHGGRHSSRDHRRSRSRDRELNRTHRTRSVSRERRHRSPSRERRRRSRSPSAQSRYSDRRTRTPSPVLSEEERDKRTVFVMQLAARLRNRELIEFFSQAGRVRDAKIIADRNTRRSKGVGYVEFHDIDSVPKAIAMTGQKLLGIPIIVQLTEAEKNRIAEQAAQAASQKVPEIAYHRLYVGSIHFNLTEDDLRQIFEPFGPVEFVNLHRDPETGRSRGFAFIQYQNPDDAKQALEKMNGFELAGRNLKVGLVTDKNSGVNFSLDDGDGNGLTLNSQSRVELMQKLAAREHDFMNTTTPSKQTIEQVRPAVPVTITSKTLVLKNMFNPAEETEPHWIQELEGDVKEECSTFGQVLHIAIDENSLGDVYLKFDSTESAQRAVAGLNGRWFGGKQIEAKHVSEMWYNAKFS